MLYVEKLGLSFFLESLLMMILKVLLLSRWKFHWGTWLFSVNKLRWTTL